MGVLSSFGGETERTYFFRSLDDGRGVELSAVVMQRHLESSLKKRRLGILGLISLLLGRRRPMPKPPVDQESQWTSTSDRGRPTEVCFSAERRMVRVSGQDIAMPNDPRTFVVFADEIESDWRNARLTTTLIEVPVRPKLSMSALDKAERGQAYSKWMQENQRIWAQAIDADAVVRRFLENLEPHQD